MDGQQRYLDMVIEYAYQNIENVLRLAAAGAQESASTAASWGIAQSWMCKAAHLMQNGV
jgi:hypothetical protein